MKRWLCFVLAAIGLFVGTAAGGATAAEQALEAQARRFWAAEVQQDWGTVYDVLPPAERNGGTREEYIVWRKEQGLVNFVAAEIGEIAVSGDLAWVRVKYEIQFARYPDVAPKKAEMWDIWRNVDGWRPVAKVEREQWPKLPPNRRPAADEAALAARSNALWQAKTAQDWKTYYRHLLPAFQARVPLDEFLTGKPKNYYLSPRVEWTEVIGGKGRAKVVFLAKPTDPAVSKMEPQQSVVIENWVKTDGDWYLDIDVPPDPKDKTPEKKAK